MQELFEQTINTWEIYLVELICRCYLAVCIFAKKNDSLVQIDYTVLREQDEMLSIPPNIMF